MKDLLLIPFLIMMGTSFSQNLLQGGISGPFAPSKNDYRDLSLTLTINSAIVTGFNVGNWNNKPNGGIAYGFVAGLSQAFYGMSTTHARLPRDQSIKNINLTAGLGTVLIVAGRLICYKTNQKNKRKYEEFSHEKARLYKSRGFRAL